jgi:hypothetical protein
MEPIPHPKRRVREESEARERNGSRFTGVDLRCRPAQLGTGISSCGTDFDNIELLSEMLKLSQAA